MTKGQRGKNSYEITDAGGVTYGCEICGKPVEKTPDEAKKFMRNGELPPHFDFMCPACWGEHQRHLDDQDKGKKPDDRDERISYAQSHNISAILVAAMITNGGRIEGNEEARQLVKGELEYWQKYAYDQLTNRN